jgi:hypothetical protein
MKGAQKASVQPDLFPTFLAVFLNICGQLWLMISGSTFLANAGSR